MPFTGEKVRAPASVRQHFDPDDSQSGVSIAVVFTSVEPTLRALRKAAELAHELNGRITIVVPQVVPYPLPLTSPPVQPGLSERRLHVFARESPVETAVQLCLCRDPSETLMAVLKAHSLVILGGRRRWWPTAEKRIAYTLQRAGHEVIFVEGE